MFLVCSRECYQHEHLVVYPQKMTTWNDDTDSLPQL